MINDGAIVGRKDTDYLAGVLPYKVILETGDWTPFLPAFEKQSNFKADSMSCVSFSCLNCIEMQVKQQTGIEPNYSDRWLAKMSGTTSGGNFLYTVADTVRNIGLVNETDYPQPPIPWTFDNWIADIPEPLLTELKMKAADWRSKWDLSYEWITLNPTEISKHLKHAPIQLVIPGHAIAGVAIKIDGNMITYLDTYDPFIKTRPLSDFSDALKLVLTSKLMNQTKVVLSKDGKTVYEAKPIAMDWENFKKQASVEGIEVPNPIPPASSL